MLNKKECKKLVEETFLGFKVKACTYIPDFYLFEVEHPHPEEKGWDPFVSVDIFTGEVRDFAIFQLTPKEQNSLEWEEV